MARAEPCPTDDLLWAIAVARLVLPAEVHVQAPPNLSDELAPLLTAGIDDWGGVSPITADHVNPERAWPALDTLRAATEGAGHVLAARLTVYPAFAHDAATWLDPNLVFPVLDVSDAEGLARDAAWCSGGEVAPPVLVGAARSDGGGAEWQRQRREWRRQRRWRACATLGRPGGRSPRWRRARAGGGRGRNRDAVLGPRTRGAHGGRGGRRHAACRGGRCRHLRAQPQHQLHQRLHFQVPLLCLLQRTTLTEPARGAVPVGARRDHPPRGGGGSRGGHRSLPAGRHPSRLRRRLLHPCAGSGPCGVGAHPHPRLHRPGGDRGRPPFRGPAWRST